MDMIEQLNNKFGISDSLIFREMENNLTSIVISNPYADAIISLYGGQVLSFKPKNELDLLYISPLSNFKIGKAIRGGIPLCFPWFGPHPTDQSKPQHGFGRLMTWEVMQALELLSGDTEIILKLSTSDETKEYWAHDFLAELTILVGKKLSVSLKITNQGTTPFNYSCALHSYYQVSDITNISIKGLNQTPYYKHGESGDFLQNTPELVFQKMEDRHYFNTEETCFIEDQNYNRTIKVSKSGSKITTVWNPWIENCASISDLPDDGYRSFVCIEAVNSFDDSITLSPGESHKTAAHLEIS
jgi:glucose-6-phosphate 1-epimerase